MKGQLGSLDYNALKCCPTESARQLVGWRNYSILQLCNCTFLDQSLCRSSCRLSFVFLYQLARKSKLRHLPLYSDLLTLYVANGDRKSNWPSNCSQRVSFLLRQMQMLALFLRCYGPYPCRQTKIITFRGLLNCVQIQVQEPLWPAVQS